MNDNVPKPCSYIINDASLELNKFYYTIPQMASIYNFPTTIPTTPTVIGVISLGGGIPGTLTGPSASGSYILTNSDCQTYWSNLGITSSNFPTVIIAPYKPETSTSLNAYITDNPSYTYENVLDVSTIGAVFPSSNLTIIVYQGQFLTSYVTNLLNVMGLYVKFAINTPVIHPLTGKNIQIPTILSISWGFPEPWVGTSGYEGAIDDNYFQQAVSKGINICVSTGDWGALNKYNTNNVNYPASSPNVIACGGTILYSPSSKYNANTSEIAWPKGGGGNSSIFTSPSYQSSLGYTKRSIPDISMHANATLFIVNGQQCIMGGTSIVAPFIAGYLGLIGVNFFINPILYNIGDVSTPQTTPYHDIVSGTIGFPTKIGYDLCTGWGSFDGVKLANFLFNTTTFFSTNDVPITNTISTNATLPLNWNTFGVNWLNLFNIPVLSSVTPPQTLSGIAMSSSGQYQCIIINNASMYSSNDYGTTWNNNNNNSSSPTVPAIAPWSSIAMSSSGQYQTAVSFLTTTNANSGYISVSTNYGLTWITNNTTSPPPNPQAYDLKFTSPKLNWSGVAMSSSGQYQTAIVNGGGIYVSKNYGIDGLWGLTNAKTASWKCVAVSSSGQYQTAIEGNNVYLSTNYGNSWVCKDLNNSSTYSLTSISMDSTGQYQTLLSYNSTSKSISINISSNYGNSWNLDAVPKTISVLSNYSSVSITSSGQYQTVVCDDGFFGIYFSINFGLTWTTKNKMNNNTTKWAGIALSSTGQYQTAILRSGGIYTSVVNYAPIYTDSVNTTSISDSKMIEFLYKKYMGVPNAFPGISYTNEAAGNARPFIFANQIYSQPIPAQCPTVIDFTIDYIIYGKQANYKSYNFTNITNITTTTLTTLHLEDTWTSIGKVYHSKTNPQIQKITGLYLSPMSPVVSPPYSSVSSPAFRFCDPSISTNYLQNAIPSNYDQAGLTYKIKLYDSVTNVEFLPQNTPKWYLDSDAGYIYFPNNDWATIFNGNLTIDFYRYNGTVNSNPLKLTTTTLGVMIYNPNTYETTYNSNKTFVINHPNDNEKYLVHACLEGPESGVYYRGTGEIVNNDFIVITLPDYVEKLAYEFTIQITPIYSGKKSPTVLQVSQIENNSFSVYGENTKFYWIVHGKRNDITVEPLKSSVDVKGNGPYKWII